MTDPIDPAEEGVGDQQDERRRRGRLLVVLLALLLLLLCVVASAADVFVGRSPDQRRFITRNLECLGCHAEKIPDFSRSSVHNPFMLKDCQTCHTPHGREVVELRTAGDGRRWTRIKSWFEWLPLRLACRVYEGDIAVSSAEGGATETTGTITREKGPASHLRQPEKDLCWTCHGDLGPLTQMEYQHAPFEGGYCTNCHSPHASDDRVLLRQNAEDLCKTCHPMGEELSRKQTHPPVAGWFCLNCHNPHASDHQGILVRRQRDLCFECHPTVAPLSLKAVQHSPFVNDNCSGCHEPHGSDFEPLLVDAQPRMCYRCHPGIENDFDKPSHHPVGTVKLNCADCHDPHGADYEFLLTARDNRFCYQCHGSTIGVTYSDSAHNGTLCVRCHTPHGSSFAPLLRDSNPELCLRCHDRYDEKHLHPVSRRFYDSHADERLTCTSTCHNPHGTRYLRMLNYPYRKDGLCLRCHPAVGMSF